MIGINTLTTIDQPVYANHLQFFFRLGRHFDESTTFAINTPRRMSIDRMRNMSAKLAVESEFDYLMFIDDDVIVPIDCLKKMLAADKDIIAGHTIIRGWPYNSMIFKHTVKDGIVNRAGLEFLNEWKPEDLDEKGLLNVDAVGFSCVLIKVSLLKKLSPPYFVTGSHNTEDIYFCMKARQFYPETTIFVDPSIKTTHCLGTEYIDPDNKEHYKEYYKKTYNDQEPITDTSGDRGQEYLDLILPPLKEENLAEKA